ncbi:MAG: hypothetical protein M3024_02205 [Candidatus Dormibacteraeota bacterium]|nr:hypothetical protein [Candidatus Dormibacteraeota bacterium]
MIGLRYLEHLGPGDIAFLEAAAGRPLRPDTIRAALSAEPVYEALFGPGSIPAPVRVSPFLVFAVLIERVALQLQTAAFVEEWLGPGRTLPVFDVQGLRDFVAVDGNRLFLAELLASYTHVASGSTWRRTPRGWRRTRYSELDPVRLAELVEALPAAERPGVLRRLGDVGLFLSGIFPERVSRHPLQPRELHRVGALLGGLPDELALAGAGGMAQLEWLGRRAYRLAALPDRDAGFGPARRVLNVLAGRHLSGQRSNWFGAEG